MLMSNVWSRGHTITRLLQRAYEEWVEIRGLGARKILSVPTKDMN